MVRSSQSPRMHSLALSKLDLDYAYRCFEIRIDVKGAIITLIGAGGAATAIAIQATLDGAAEINMFNKKDAFWDKSQETVNKVREHMDLG